MTTYFTSDSHFGHARIITLCNRPFKDVSHMNASLVRWWNETVMPDDTVFHLGDVALGTLDDSLACVSQLNGFKILVNGNHDRPFMTMGKARHGEWVERYNEVFQEQHEGTITATLSDGTDVLLSHFPFTGDSHDGDRYIDHRPVDSGIPLIHGHTHKEEIVNHSSKGTPMIHVGVDAWDFTPVSEDQIISILNNLR